MKRAASPTTLQSEGPRHRRQDQVSCNLCRQRKVRCNRVQPCANCALRGLECVFPQSSRNISLAYPPSESSSPSSQFEGGSKVSEEKEDRTLRQIQGQLANLENSMQNNSSTKDVKDRLERIEKTLNSQIIANPGTLQANIYVNVDARGQTSPDEAAAWLEQLAMNTTQIGKAKGLDTPKSLLFGMDFDETEVAEDAMGSGAYIRIVTTPLGPVNILLPENGVIGLLPSQPKAKLLVNIFQQRIAWMHHVIHFPTMEHQINDIYSPVGSPDLSELALLFALMGVTMFYNSTDTKYKLEKSKTWADRYMTAAWLALEEAGWTSSPTVAGLQAGVVLSHMLPNVGRFTQFFVLIGQMIRICQSMGIGQIDSPKAWEQRMNVPEEQDWVMIEIKRRIWWNLVSQEWFMSCMAGPGEGLSCIQPNRFAVAYPTHVDDINITNEGDHVYVVPLTQPTECSFLLQRIKLSEICQKISLAGPSMSYETLLAIDREFQALYKAIPSYFRFDNPAANAQILSERPYLAWQRNICHLVSNRKLCILHRPYLIMGYSQPNWTYSRMICLQAAMQILNIQQDIEGDGPDGQLGFPFTTVWVYMHSVLTAVVVLLMDYCYHPDDPLWEVRRNSILRACRTLERAKTESEVARRGISSLYEFWRSWRSAPQMSDSLSTSQAEGLESLGNELRKTAGVDPDQIERQGVEEHLQDWFVDVMNCTENYDQQFWDAVLLKLDGH